MSWSAPLSNGGSAVTAYDVRYKPSTVSEPWTTVDEAWTSGVLTYNITDLENGTEYDVAVRAVNGAGQSLWSETSSATPRTVAGVPSINEVAGDDTKLDVSWTAPEFDGGSEITSFDVRYIPSSASDTDKDDSSKWGDASTLGQARTYEITELKNGTQYDVQVRAVNVAGEGLWSDTAAGTPMTVATMPLNVEVAGDDTKLRVSWKAPELDGGSEITGYKVRYIPSTASDTDKDDSSKWGDASTLGQARTYEIDGLENGTQYDVQVRAVNTAGEGLWSDTAVGTPMTVATMPLNVEVAGDDTKLRVSWKAPEFDGGSEITAYKVRYILNTASDTDKDDSSKWGDASTLGQARTYEIDGLENGTQYDVQVRAINAAGEGQWSETAVGAPIALATHRPHGERLSGGLR